jgi:hypothetical protein
MSVVQLVTPDLDSRIGRSYLLSNLKAVVRGCVVDDEHPDVDAGLANDAVYALAEVPAIAIARHNDVDATHRANTVIVIGTATISFGPRQHYGGVVVYAVLDSTS